MIKTQIQLEKWQYDGLKRLSRQESRSLADLVRQAVTQLVRTAKAQPLPLEELAGKYRPSPTSDLKRHDRDWVEAAR